MTTEIIAGWDIGGAHLKMAQVQTDGRILTAMQIASPLWHGLDVLDQAMTETKSNLSGAVRKHVITTTAELADIFPDRTTGLQMLVRQCRHLFDDTISSFYAGDYGWVTFENVKDHTEQIASANWHATASFVANSIENGILVDIGSTTTDIIPFSNGRLLNRGYSDYTRLACNELVYTGCVRTPVMALTDRLLIDEVWHPLVTEHFATTADIYRLTGELQEQDDMYQTVDRSGKQVDDSARRLARMFGTDLNHPAELNRWQGIAGRLADIQLIKIQTAYDQVRSRLSGKEQIKLIGAGAGRFIAKKLARISGLDYIDFADLLDASPEVRSNAARSASAVAVAQLAIRQPMRKTA